MSDAVETSMINGEVQAALAPSTFLIPSEDERWSLRIGDFAKIGITSAAGGERFWVKISKMRDVMSDEPTYVGSVDNDLIIYEIPIGESIEFDPCHVLSIIRDGRTVH